MLRGLIDYQPPPADASNPFLPSTPYDERLARARSARGGIMGDAMGPGLDAFGSPLADNSPNPFVTPRAERTADSAPNDSPLTVSPFSPVAPTPRRDSDAAMYI